MLRECVSFGVEHDLRLADVVAHDERSRIVDQHFLRYAAERREGALEPGEPVLLLLGPRTARTCSRRECPSVGTNI